MALQINNMLQQAPQPSIDALCAQESANGARHGERHDGMATGRHAAVSELDICSFSLWTKPIEPELSCKRLSPSHSCPSSANTVARLGAAITCNRLWATATALWTPRKRLRASGCESCCATRLPLWRCSQVRVGHLEWHGMAWTSAAVNPCGGSCQLPPWPRRRLRRLTSVFRAAAQRPNKLLALFTAIILNAGFLFVAIGAMPAPTLPNRRRDRPQFVPNVVLVRLKSPSASPGASAAAAAAAASGPTLKGVKLQRLVGGHQGVKPPTGGAAAATAAATASTATAGLPSGAVLLLSITDNTTVEAKVAELNAYAGEFACGLKCNMLLAGLGRPPTTSSTS